MGSEDDAGAGAGGGAGPGGGADAGAELSGYVLRTGHDIGGEHLVALYASVGWTAYTRDLHGLQRAVRQSTHVVSAWSSDGVLLGLARGLSDDVSVFYLQDLLVRPSHQRRGIGSELLAACLERFGHVRQKVLLTDGDEAQRRLYESFGYVRTTDFGDASLEAYVRFDP